MLICQETAIENILNMLYHRQINTSMLISTKITDQNKEYAKT